MTSSKILFFLSISFIIGIFLESLVKIPQFILWIFLFLAILTILVSFLIRGNSFGIRKYSLVAGFCILLFIIGILRFQISEFNVANDKLSQFNGKGQVVLEGIISGEPDVRENSQKLTVEVGNSRILVTTNKYPEYVYLDSIKLTGELEEPMVFEDFNYKNYLLKDHIHSVMNFSKIEFYGKSKGNLMQKIYSEILWFKGGLRQSIQNSFLPSQSSVLQGIILGDKSAISQDIKDKFKFVGLSHTIAVSGMHVAVLSSIIMSFLLLLGLWRGQAFWGAAIFICIYIVLVGIPASAVRAGIMGVIYLSSQALGRQAVGARIIVLVAVLMLLANPLLLFYDIGFQLSFLAVSGLIYFEPVFRSFIKFLTKKLLNKKIEGKYENAFTMFTVTISAQIFTLPIIIYNFGIVSVVSPITNILVVPIIYYVMFFGFLSSLVGMVWGSLGWILSLPCYFLMTYFLWVVDIFAKPWAYKNVSGVSWIWLPASYLILGFTVWFLNRKYNRAGYF